MNILITGGVGFLGSNLAHSLAQKGHKVYLYDNHQRTIHNIPDLLKAECKVIKGELDDVQDLLRKQTFDRIFHFAAQVTVTDSYENPKNDFRVNAQGTFNLVSSTKTPVIYASTNKVYGDNVNNIPLEELETRYDFSGEFKGKGVHENFPIDARKHTPYGVSKLTGELYVREFNGIVNRFSCLYGPRQFGHVDQGWISHFIKSKLKNEPLQIFGDGKQIRDILYVEDAVRLLELQMERLDELQGEVFNIGGGYANTLSLLELCKMLNITPSFADWRPADQKVYYSDISKAKKVLGWEPKVSRDDGVKKLETWTEKNINKFM